MKRWLWLGLAVCCAAALAQQPGPDDDRGVPGEAGPEAVQGVVAETVADNPVVDADGEADGEGEGEADEEFTPTEEIPEDYPVPLPSDI